MIDAVLFDLGDTLIDFTVGRRDAELLFRQGAKLSYRSLRTRGCSNLPAYERYFKTHLRIMRRAYFWSKISGRDFSYETVLVRAASKLQMRFSEAELRQLARIWYEPISLASTVDSAVPAMLERLRSAGTKMGIVSNTIVPSHCLDQHLEEEGLLEYFPVRVYSSHVRYRKPHPRIFAMALELIGVPAHRTLFIGDLLKSDIAGAKKAGMHTIWKPAHGTNGNLPLTRRPHFADCVINRVTRLTEVLPQFGWRGSRELPQTE